MKQFVNRHRWPLVLLVGLTLLLLQGNDDTGSRLWLLTLLLGGIYIAYLHHDYGRKLQKQDAALLSTHQQQQVVNQHAIVSITDLEGNIRHVNDKFLQISGYRREELIGQNHRIVKSGQQGRHFYEMMWHSLKQGKTWHGQLHNRAKNGDTYWLESTIAPLCNADGEIDRYLAICTDITAQKSMQDQVKSSRWLLQNVMDTLGEGVYMLDAQGFCTYVNREAERMLGWRSEELLGCNLHDKIHSRLPDGGHLPAAECPAYLSMRDGRIFRSDNEYFEHKSGRLFPVSMVASPIDHGRGMTGSVAAFQDITERKQYEQELRRAKEAAEAASKAKGDFLATMSHEIRTPMNGIIGMTDLALDTPLNSEQREYLELVRSSADSLLNILNDILDFSKIESGKIELERVDFSLHELLALMLKPLALRANDKGLELVYDVDEGTPATLLGDPGRLRQVLTNLVGNAIKFSEQGEIAVHVALVSQDTQEVMLKFSVTDQGIGIPVDKQLLVFDAFSQADSSTTRKYGGTGLGLSISSELVKQMGGRLQLDSTENIGSTFYFTLPFGLSDMSSPLPDLQKQPVLIVDDNATNRRYFEKVLRHLGLQPTLAVHAADALVHIAQQTTQPYPLILLDACMPDMDGYHLADTIKQIPAYANSKLIMLSSAGERPDQKQNGKLVIDRFLTKPVSQADLRACIEAVLGISSPPPPDTPTLPSQHGLSILLAEDNLVNQRLAETLLEKWGHRVDIADNGLSAVSKSGQGQYDLILMDVQMPDMSGIEATELIRQRELGGNQHIPIVAMTANALSEDRERCLRAGMDDYLSKPLKADKFAALIARFASLRHPATDSRHEKFDYAQALRLADQEIIAIIAAPFLEEYSVQMDKLSAAIATRHVPTLTLVLHSFKGLVGNFNAKPVQQVLQHMEQLLAQEKLDELSMEYDKLQHTAQGLLQALRHYVDGQ